jgi:cytoskeletal protein RodZ
MSATVGKLLQQAREARSLSLDDAALATRIRQHYLRALESDELETLPSLAQGRGFLRAYADYLGLDSETLLGQVDHKPALDGPAPAMASPAPVAALPATAFPATAFPGAASPARNAPAIASPEADAIFQDLGSQLQRQRELLGLSLEDVERHTHLREHYLTALEAGRLDDLPSPVQGRGMLKNYAAFLGMNPELLLLRFADGLQARLAARVAAQQPAHPTAAKRRKRRGLPRLLRRLLSGDILIGGTLTVLLGLIVFWVAIRIYAMTAAQTPEPTAPSIAQVLLTTATASPTPTALPSSPTLAPTQAFPTAPPATDPVTGDMLTPNPGGGVQVYISVRERAWMRVLVDGKVEFEGRVLPGSAYPFAGGNTVEVVASSGSALQITQNGLDLGVMGAFGEVVNRIYSVQGIVTPTPSITPTPPPTLPVTPTPAATQPAGTAPALP